MIYSYHKSKEKRVMKSHRKVFVGVIVTVLLIIVVVAAIATRADQSRELTGTPSVRYAAPLTIAAAPVYVAAELGLWDDEGIDVSVTYFDSGRKALDALLSNNAEVMSVSETPPLRAFLSGQKIKIITTVTDHKEAKITVRTDRISTPQDIKGKKIGTVAGTNSDYYMYRWLEANNIDKVDVDIIPLDAGALSQAFVQGEIDVMFAWEPFNYNAISKIPTLAESWPTKLYSGRHTVVVNDNYLKANPKIAEAVIRGFIKAENYIKTNPNEAKKLLRKERAYLEKHLISFGVNTFT
jgi:NitT/TauT family transport system substrate-binding protein